MLIGIIRLPTVRRRDGTCPRQALAGELSCILFPSRRKGWRKRRRRTLASGFRAQSDVDDRRQLRRCRAHSVLRPFFAARIAAALQTHLRIPAEAHSSSLTLSGPQLIPFRQRHLRTAIHWRGCDYATKFAQRHKTGRAVLL